MRSLINAQGLLLYKNWSLREVGDNDSNSGLYKVGTFHLQNSYTLDPK